MLKFAKMHGLGNDFIVFDAINEKLPDYSQLAKKVCHRNFGIGADGILVIEKSSVADVKMEIYNSDGSRAMMCGNGLRCFSKYVFDNGYVNKEEFTVETLAGVMKSKVYIDDGIVNSIKINLGEPIFNSELIPKNPNEEKILNTEIEIEGNKYNISTLILGCVHTVLFPKNFEDVDITKVGPLIEKNPLFPSYTNVDFCKIIDDNNIVVKTWEIGAGETLACGTGAASAAVISRLLYNTNEKVTVHLPGGKAEIEIKDNSVYMIGPAELICSGIYIWK